MQNSNTHATKAGKPRGMNPVLVDNIRIITEGRFPKLAMLEEKWFGEVHNPGEVIRAIKESQMKADIFTFCQRLPETTPKFDYHMEWDYVAAIPVESYHAWFEKQINPGARKAIKKAEKKGILVRIAEFNDEFVRGMTSIVNETPIRQGRPYQHYGKDFDALKKEYSRDADRCDFLGAYYNDELIGFIKLFQTSHYAIPFGMVSKIEHRDKSPQNAILAKAIEVCEKKGLQYLLYGEWSRGGLGDFKKNNGCIKIALPRYYIPLNLKGKIGLKLGLQHGLSALIPEKVILRLIQIRKSWYTQQQAKQVEQE